MEVAERPPEAESNDGFVRRMLDTYGRATRQALRDWIPRGEPDDYLYRLLGDYPNRGGKMMRSSLCLAAARVSGGTLEEAMPTAVSIELLHNALLVHDDIEDDSHERRGTPTLHALYGVPLAINAGDAMGLLSVKPLFHNFTHLGIATAARLLRETDRVAWLSAEGQALELGWQRDNRTDLTEDDYLNMVLLKTCWLGLIHPLRAGCLIGSRGRLPLDPLVHIGFLCGAAFQIQDDLLNVEPGARYGKERLGDLVEGKRTLLIVHALREAAPRDRRRLVELLGRPRRGRGEREVSWMHALLIETGAVEHARVAAYTLAEVALREFDEYFASARPCPDLDFLRASMVWVTRRDQ